MGNDPPDRTLVTTSTLDTASSPNRKQFEMVKDQQPPYPVTVNEKVVDSENLRERFPQMTKAGPSSFIQASADSPSEEEDVPRFGQNMKSSFHHNGPHTPLYEYSELQAHNHIGPCTPEAQLKEHNSPHQQQQLITNGLQVYSRRKWCKNKKVQQELLTDTNSALSVKEKEEITERQCELLNQMGMTCGGDFQQLMGCLVDMEAEKGDDKGINDNSFI